MPLVTVTLAEGAFTEKQKHDLAARLTDVMVAFEGSEAFREVVWVLIEELNRDGWHIGGQPLFRPAPMISPPRPAPAAHHGPSRHPAHPADLGTHRPVP